MKIKIFFDVLGETRGILLDEGVLPSLSVSESDNLSESIAGLVKTYISQDMFYPLTRPAVYQIEGEIVICYRIVLTIFPKWLKKGQITELNEVLKRGPHDETVFVIQSFR